MVEIMTKVKYLHSLWWWLDMSLVEVALTSSSPCLRQNDNRWEGFEKRDKYQPLKLILKKAQ